MAEKPPEIKRYTVKEGDSEMEIIQPLTGDKSYDEYLEEAEREKTADQLKKAPTKPKSIVPREQIAGSLREFREFLERKRKGDIKRFY